MDIRDYTSTTLFIVVEIVPPNEVFIRTIVLKGSELGYSSNYEIVGDHPSAIIVISLSRDGEVVIDSARVLDSLIVNHISALV